MSHIVSRSSLPTGKEKQTEAPSEFFSRPYSNFFKRKSWTTPVNHRVAVGANRDQIFNRINFIFLLYLSKRDNMVHLDVFESKVPIEILEVEFAYLTDVTIVIDAWLSG